MSDSVEINCSTIALFRFVTDVPKLPKWAGAFKSIRNFSGAPAGVGTTWQAVNKTFGQEIVSKLEITEFQEGRLCVAKVDSPAFSGLNTWAFETTYDGRAKFTLSIEGETKGFLAGLAKPIMERQAATQMRNDLLDLKAMLENGHL
jgi:uncharacterized membrane protein